MYLFYLIALLDLLVQVWKLGILRNLGTLIGNLVEALAKEGNLPLGTGENTLIAMNERLLHMSRRCLANRQPPGYVGVGNVGASFVDVWHFLFYGAVRHVNSAAILPFIAV